MLARPDAGPGALRHSRHERAARGPGRGLPRLRRLARAATPRSAATRPAGCSPRWPRPSGDDGGVRHREREWAPRGFAAASARCAHRHRRARPRAAGAAAEIFADDDQVEVVAADWSTLRDRGPFSLLFLDAREPKDSGADSSSTSWSRAASWSSTTSRRASRGPRCTPDASTRCGSAGSPTTGSPRSRSWWPATPRPHRDETVTCSLCARPKQSLSRFAVMNDVFGGLRRGDGSAFDEMFTGRRPARVRRGPRELRRCRRGDPGPRGAVAWGTWTRASPSVSAATSGRSRSTWCPGSSTSALARGRGRGQAAGAGTGGFLDDI